MSKHIKILSFNRRRDRADEIETAEATEYFGAITADIAAHRDEPLGTDVDPAAETCVISAVTPQPVSPRPPARPARSGWTEQDVRGFRLESVGTFGSTPVVVDQNIPALAAAEIVPADGPLPERRRRHLPAVGAWFADRLKPVPLPGIPAIPDAGRFRLAEIPTALELAESGRLALEAAASTEIEDEPDDEPHPDDFIAWLRAEFAEIDAQYDSIVAEHAKTAQNDLDALGSGYFQNVDLQLAELNTMTLPGWTSLETAIYRTGAFAS